MLTIVDDPHNPMQADIVALVVAGIMAFAYGASKHGFQQTLWGLLTQTHLHNAVIAFSLVTALSLAFSRPIARWHTHKRDFFLVYLWGVILGWLTKTMYKSTDVNINSADVEERWSPHGYYALAFAACAFQLRFPDHVIALLCSCFVATYHGVHAAALQGHNVVLVCITTVVMLLLLPLWIVRSIEQRARTTFLDCTNQT